MATTDLRIGSELAGYRIEALIGRGGMGVVYRAEDLRLGRKVALKLLAPELVENEAFKVRFDRESRLAAAIDHPNIIPLYEAREVDGLLFITMRYVEGTDLRSVIAKSGRLDPMRAVAMVGQVAAALDAAHQRGLVHRDVKPANVLVASGAGPESSEHCYLTDFGLTKDTSSSEELTEAGQFVGTLEYVAPEQIESAKPDGRADEYALACVMFECLTGTPPFKADSDVGVMYAHLHGERPQITAARSDLPAGLNFVLSKALARAPEDRYATCGAFVSAVKTELEDAGFVAAAPTIAGGTAAPVPAGLTRIAEPIPTRLAQEPGATVLSPAEPKGATVPAAEIPATVAPSAPARGVPPPVVAAATATVIAAGVLGAVLGSSGDSAEKVAGNVAAAGGLRLHFPGTWQTGSDPKIPGLKLSDPLALVPKAGGAGSGLVAGGISNHDARLLPTSLVAVLPAKSPARDVVKIGQAEAFRYRGLTPQGFSGTLTLYVVPTDSRIQGIACFAPRASSSTLRDCETIAASLTVSGAKPLAVQTDATYAKGLSSALKALASARDAGRKTLKAAGSAKAQAGPAQSLATSYRAAVKAVRALKPPPLAAALNRVIATDLDNAADGYAKMASAARDGDSSGFAAGRGVVQGAEKALRRALDGLAGLGYEVSA
jgi:serine/threonine-protein kinase